MSHNAKTSTSYATMTVNREERRVMIDRELLEQDLRARIAELEAERDEALDAEDALNELNRKLSAEKTALRAERDEALRKRDQWNDRYAESRAEVARLREALEGLVRRCEAEGIGTAWAPLADAREALGGKQ